MLLSDCAVGWGCYFAIRAMREIQAIRCMQGWLGFFALHDLVQVRRIYRLLEAVA